METTAVNSLKRQLLEFSEIAENHKATLKDSECCSQWLSPIKRLGGSAVATACCLGCYAPAYCGWKAGSCYSLKWTCTPMESTCHLLLQKTGDMRGPKQLLRHNGMDLVGFQTGNSRAAAQA